MRDIVLDGRRVADETPCYVIGEIGSNHGGDVAMAVRLIQRFAATGVDAVKFQKRDNAQLYTQALLDAPYTSEHAYGPTYGAHRAALELDNAAFQRIRGAARHAGVTWFATPFDEASVAFLERQNVPFYKVHSGGVTDHALLRTIAQTGKPVLVSTGGASWADVDAAHECLQGVPHALLHCTAAYPITAAQAHLSVIPAMRARYPDTVIGWSSHAPGIALSLMAYALGARILEHHVTLNRAAKGTDQAFSLEPKGMQTLVEDLAQCQAAFGHSEKQCHPEEQAPIAKMRRRATSTGWRIGG